MGNTRNQETGQPLDQKTYLAAREEYNKAELEVSGRYDRWILTLSGGALAISLTFLEKIVPNPKPYSIVIIGVAWSLLLASLLAGLLSLVTSQSAIREQREELDKANVEHRPTAHDRRPLFTRLTNHLNWCSMGFFIGGTILLCVFSILNV